MRAYTLPPVPPPCVLCFVQYPLPTHPASIVTSSWYISSFVTSSLVGHEIKAHRSVQECVDDTYVVGYDMQY